MKAKKIALWFFDAVVFVAIAIYRSIVGYTDDHYISLSDSWFSDVYYAGSTQVTVYDEPFFIVCMIIMGIYLLSAIYTKATGTDSDGIFLFKIIAYIAALVSVSYMYSGDWDPFIVIALGLISIAIEVVISDKKSQKEE